MKEGRSPSWVVYNLAWGFEKGAEVRDRNDVLLSRLAGSGVR